MAKQPVTFNEQELSILENALEQALASAKRGQNTAKQPEFKELYKQAEGKLQAILGKIKA